MDFLPVLNEYMEKEDREKRKPSAVGIGRSHEPANRGDIPHYDDSVSESGKRKRSQLPPEPPEKAKVSRIDYSEGMNANIPTISPLKVFIQQETFDLLTSLYNNPRYSSQSKRRFYQAVKEDYPQISYDDVSQFMEMRPDYKLFKAELFINHKLTKPKKRSRSERTPQQQKTAVRVMKPNYKWQIDITHPPLTVDTVGSKNILTIIDVFSKYAFAFPIPDKKGETVAFWLKMIFSRYRAPIIIQTDGGREFLGPNMKSLLEKYQVKHVVNPPYTPLGIVERFNQTFKNMLAHANKVTGGSLRLDMLIDQVLDNYNSLTHSSHKHSPKDVHFSKDPIVRWSARKINMAVYNKSNDRVIPYEKDQLVFVNIIDWPDHDSKVKTALFNQVGTAGLKKVMYNKKIENQIKIFQIDSRISVPGSNPVVYVYRIRSTGPIKVFTKNYLHQQLHIFT